jgi:hypothetical protein
LRGLASPQFSLWKSAFSETFMAFLSIGWQCLV